MTGAGIIALALQVVGTGARRFLSMGGFQTRPYRGVNGTGCGFGSRVATMVGVATAEPERQITLARSH